MYQHTTEHLITLMLNIAMANYGSFIQTGLILVFLNTLLLVDLKTEECLIHLRMLSLQRNTNSLLKNPNLAEASLITNMQKEWFTNGGEEKDLEMSLIHLKDHTVPGPKSIGNMVVSIYSRDAMYRLIKTGIPKNTAIISFSDTEEDFIRFSKGTDVLHVAFYDVRPFTVAKHHYDRILPQAKEIADYIICKRKEGKDFICQCDYGVSRSAGCAAAILEMWNHKGLEIFADYRYTPNQFVYNKVLKELKERNKQHGKLRN